MRKKIRLEVKTNSARSSTVSGLRKQATLKNELGVKMAALKRARKKVQRKV